MLWRISRGRARKTVRRRARSRAGRVRRRAERKVERRARRRARRRSERWAKRRARKRAQGDVLASLKSRGLVHLQQFIRTERLSVNSLPQKLLQNRKTIHEYSTIQRQSPAKTDSKQEEYLRIHHNP